MTQDSKLLRVVLSVKQSRDLGHRAVDNDLTPADFVRAWIDGGMPLTAESVKPQPTAVGVDVAAGKWLATVNLLEGEIVELKDRLKLAQASKKQAAPVASNEREEQLLRDWHEVSGKLEKAEANLLLVMTTSDQQLARIRKLEEEIAERRAAVAPETAFGIVQVPKAVDEVPVGMTKVMGEDGRVTLVEAQDPGF